MYFITYSSCPCCNAATIEKKLQAKDFTVTGQTFEIWECAQCTLRFTQAVPDEASVGEWYRSENYISHTDTKEGLINKLYHAVRKRTLKQKRRLIEGQTGKSKGSLLDIGAGTGAFSNIMQQAGWQVKGLEPDASTRAKANELYDLSLHKIDELFQLPEASFDAITMWHVLEHVHALHAYIEQIRKLLKPGGKLFIAVPNYTSYDARVYKEFWAAYDVPRHLYHFSPASMESLFKQHGLSLRSVKPMWYDSFYISMLSEQYKKGKTNYISAVFTGFISNLQTFFNRKKCSSVIYIAQIV